MCNIQGTMYALDYWEDAQMTGGNYLGPFKSKEDAELVAEYFCFKKGLFWDAVGSESIQETKDGTPMVKLVSLDIPYPFGYALLNHTPFVDPLQELKRIKSTLVYIPIGDC